MELEHSKSVGIIKMLQEQKAQVKLERQWQQQDVNLLAQKLAKDLQHKRPKLNWNNKNKGKI